MSLTATEAQDPLAVAVIGMGVRLPGAADLADYRANLRSGRVLIERFQPAGGGELVGAEATLAGIEDFDHEFFGLSRAEAAVIDPQHRLLLECAWHALEDAGYRPRSVPGPAGVCVGAGLSSYLVRNLLHNQDVVDTFGGFGLLTRNDKDYASALLAHRLGLRGPAYGVASGCSSSLLAVHNAVGWLTTGQCEVALAGGVSVQVPQRQGTAPVGGIYSAAGRCRPFDAEADGTVGGSGAGVVVLRRLADAIRDGDHIWAVIRGSATNSEGAERMSFTAPSIRAQYEVITEALQVAGIEPVEIGLIEAHGTGTPLGDQVELTALSEAVGRSELPCLVGSVKAAIGHLDVAAGVAGLIKACLAVHDATIFGQPEFSRANPELPFADSRLQVPTGLSDWPGTGPRRAGVSSFGAGGANVHVVLEEPPPPPPPQPVPTAQPPAQSLVPVTAGSATALADLLASTTAAVLAAPATVPDLGHTLLTARQPNKFRSCLLVNADGSVAGDSGAAEPATRQVVFAFPGDGGLTEGVAAQLYLQDPAFAAALDECARQFRVADPAGPDVRALLTTGADLAIEAPELVQPVLFSLEFALATALIARGVRPAALVGHSLGELVAATVAQCLTLAEAARLVTARAAAFTALPAGGMIAVSVAAEQLGTELLTDAVHGDVSLAALNGPQQTVVAGSPAALTAFAERAGQAGLQARRLSATRAYHSPALSAVLPSFADRIAGLPSRPPQLPMVSSCTGEWVDGELGPQHWQRQLQAPVRFADAVRTACSAAEVVVLELGPGHALAAMLRQQPELASVAVVTVAGVPATPPAWTLRGGAGGLLRAVAQLWAHGATIAASSLVTGGRRISAPSTPLDSVRCWVEPDPAPADSAGMVAQIPTDRLDPAGWLTAPSWQRAARLAAPTGDSGPVLLLCRDDQRGTELAAALAADGAQVSTVLAGPELATTAHGWVVRPEVEDDLAYVVSQLTDEQVPTLVVHAWCLADEQPAAHTLLAELDQRLELSGQSVLSLAKAVELAHPGRELVFAALTEGAEDVLGGELMAPDQVTALSVARVLAREHPHWTVRGIDVGARPGQPAGAVVAEIRQGTEVRVALRGAHRWLPALAPVRAPVQPPSGGAEPGHYLIVGGFGAMGSAIAGWLTGPGTRLTIVSRTPADDARGQAVSAWQRAGAQVSVAVGDVADLATMTEILERAEARFGVVDGVVHAAGETDQGGVVIGRDRSATARHLATKVRGALVLDRLFDRHELRFMLLNASIGSVLHRLKFGEVGYVAGSDFMLAMAHYRSSRPGRTFSIAWTDWRESGMWFSAQQKLRQQYDAGELAGFGLAGSNPLEHDVLQGLSTEEGLQTLARVLAGTEPVSYVSTLSLPALVAAQDEFDAVSHGRMLDQMGLRRPGRQAGAPVDGPAAESVAAVVQASWTALLGPDRWADGDDFFGHGGDSLLALRFCARLRDRFGIDYPMSRLFTNSSFDGCVRDVSSYLAQAEVDSR